MLIQLRIARGKIAPRKCGGVATPHGVLNHWTAVRHPCLRVLDTAIDVKPSVISRINDSGMISALLGANWNGLRGPCVVCRPVDINDPRVEEAGVIAGGAATPDDKGAVITAKGTCVMGDRGRGGSSVGNGKRSDGWRNSIEGFSEVEREVAIGRCDGGGGNRGSGGLSIAADTV